MTPTSPTDRCREALLCCPFCGGEAREGNAQLLTSHIYCKDCEAATGAHFDKEAAIASWNLRHPAPQVDMLVAALDEFVRCFELNPDMKGGGMAIHQAREALAHYAKE